MAAIYPPDSEHHHPIDIVPGDMLAAPSQRLKAEPVNDEARVYPSPAMHGIRVVAQSRSNEAVTCPHHACEGMPQRLKAYYNAGLLPGQPGDNANAWQANKKRFCL
jgi:hypothetical protein